ncbi:MAG: hypothetical protein R2765_03490 [Ferruginibacter sp.]
MRANEGTSISGIKTVIWLDTNDATLQPWIHAADTIYLNTK